MLDLAEGAQQAAAVDPHVASRRRPHQPELDGEPEEPGHRPKNTGERADPFHRIADFRNQCGGGMRALAESDQRFREVRIGVHGDVPGDVVENIRFRQVIQPSRGANGDGGRKFAAAQAIEKQERRHVSGYRAGPESGQRRQEAVDVLQTWNPVLGQT